MNKIIMGPDEAAIFPESKISQLGVGCLEISSQAYHSLGKSQFAYSISIYKDKGECSWGDKIFEGSLKELINLVARANQCPIIKEEKECHSEKS